MRLLYKVNFITANLNLLVYLWQVYTHQFQYPTPDDTFVSDTSIYVYRPHLKCLSVSVGGYTVISSQFSSCSSIHKKKTSFSTDSTSFTTDSTSFSADSTSSPADSTSFPSDSGWQLGRRFGQGAGAGRLQWQNHNHTSRSTARYECEELSVILMLRLKFIVLKK